MSGTVERLYAEWQAAREAVSGAEDWERADRAEQVAWDAFRDECDVVYGAGPCPHPVCPGGREGVE